MGTRHVPGLGCPAQLEDLGSATWRMASRHPGGGSHVFDRLHRGRGGHRYRGVEDGRALLGWWATAPSLTRVRFESGHGADGGRSRRTNSRYVPPRGSTARNVEESGQRPWDRERTRVSSARTSFSTAGDGSETGPGIRREWRAGPRRSSTGRRGFGAAWAPGCAVPSSCVFRVSFRGKRQGSEEGTSACCGSETKAWHGTSGRSADERSSRPGATAGETLGE